jgi:hypothetical protein
MAERIATILGAAIACALLAAAIAHGQAFGGLLVYLAALPIMIVTLGWGALDGLVTGVLAIAVVSGLLGLAYGLAAATSLALPAYVLGAVARAPNLMPWLKRDASPRRASLGFLGVLAAAIGGGLTLASLIAFVFTEGGVHQALDGATIIVETIVKSAFEQAGAAYDAVATHEEIAQLVTELPLTIAAMITATLLLNLYLASRAVSFSGRLTRPWVDVPSGFALPRWLALVFLVALVVAIKLPENVDQPVWIAVGALFVLYLFQGLATLHALTRGLPVRPLALMALYAALMLRPDWIGLLIALVGLAESALLVRKRAALSVKP